MLQKNILGVAFFSTFVFATSAFAGKVELTTYFPIPYAEYTNLYSTKTSSFATDPGEYVGIGTATPLSKLHLSGGWLSIQSDGNDYNENIRLLPSTNGGHSSLVFGAVDAVSGTGVGQWTWAASPAAGNYTFVFDYNGSPFVNILTDGNIGIGDTNPGYKLTVNGTAWCTAGAWASDLRWKKDITPLKDPLEKLLRLRGVEFDWKREEFKDKNFPEGRQIGMIAQEVEKEFPELVMTGQDGYKAMAYDKLTAVLLEGLKTQQKEVDLLNKDIAELKKLHLKKEAGKV